MPASWSASVTSLVKTIVGAGILGLPFAFAQTGVALGVALLVLSGAAQLFALQLLSALVVDAKEHSTPSYRSLALAAFGSDVGASAVEAINGVHCFGTATAYLIVVGDLCPQLASLCVSPDGGLALLLERRIWIAVIGVAVELPLFWQRTLEALKVTSTIGNAAVTAVGVLTAAFAVGALQTSGPPPVPVSLLPPAEDVAPMATKVGVLGVFVFAYACAMNIPTLVLELERPSTGRVASAVGCGIGLSAVLYIIVGWCGTVAFGAEVAPNLLLSFPVDPAAGALATASGVIARSAMTFTVVCTFPLLMHPTRNAFSLVCMGRPASALGDGPWALVTLGLFACSLTVAMLVSSLDLALGLVGGSTGMLIGFIFPALFYDRIKGQQANEPSDYRLLGAGAGTGEMDWNRMGARALVIGGSLLIPILVGAQLLKIMHA